MKPTTICVYCLHPGPHSAELVPRHRSVTAMGISRSRNFPHGAMTSTSSDGRLLHWNLRAGQGYLLCRFAWNLSGIAMSYWCDGSIV